MTRSIIPANQHVFIAGRTGSGKTYLARKYLTNYENVVVLDTKGTFEWPELNDNEYTLVRKFEDLNLPKTSKIVYRPDWEELEEEYYNAFFQWAYMRRNTIVMIDEVMSICPNPFKIPDYYKAILTRGRELNVAAWSLTQRPSGIPQVIMSESMHYFIFDLNLTQDREKIAEISGWPEFMEKPGKYVFWYWKADGENPPVKAKLVERKN